MNLASDATIVTTRSGEEAGETGVYRADISRIARAVTCVGLQIIGKPADGLNVVSVEFLRLKPNQSDGLTGKQASGFTV